MTLFTANIESFMKPITNAHLELKAAVLGCDKLNGVKAWLSNL